MKHKSIGWFVYNLRVLRKVCGLIWGHYLVAVGKSTKLRNLSLVLLLGLELILLIVVNAIPVGFLRLLLAFVLFGVAYVGLFTMIADTIYEEAIQIRSDRKTFRRRLDEIVNPTPATTTITSDQTTSVEK